MRKKKVKYLLLITTILFISIGFAIISTNLSINGLFNFTENTWKISLKNIVLDNNSSTKSSPTINNDENTITFSATLNKPGDYYSFNVDILNESTIDAMLGSITITGITSEYSDYLSCVVTYSNGTTPNPNDILYKTARVTFNIKLLYKEITISQIPANVLNPSITITINYKQANNNAVFISDTNHWDFNYTGSEESFTTPYTGAYKLEVWGAQGATNNYTKNDVLYHNPGGYGGYSKGNIQLNANQKLYLRVGEKGKSSSLQTFAFGDGGKGQLNGGGATHIATVTGNLYLLEDNKDKILIVAGGGGGNDTCQNKNISAGGYIAPSTTNYYGVLIEGGTQSAKSYPTDYSGLFGKGGASHSTTTDGGGSGGGGYYGGDGSNTTADCGTGGSGYIGNTNLTDKIMYCYKCQSSVNEEDETQIKTRPTDNISIYPISNYAKSENGYAKITIISLN